MARFSYVDLPAGGVLKETAERLRARLVGFEIVYFACFGPFLALDALGVFEPLGEWGPTLIYSLLAPLADGAIVLLLIGDDRCPIGDVLVGALRFYPILLMVRFLKTLAVMAGAMAMVVPAVIMAAWFAVADVVAVNERVRDPFRALFRSRDLVRGQTIPVIVAFAPLVIPVQIAGTLIFLYGGVAVGEPDPWTYPVNVLIDQFSLAVTAIAVVVHGRLERPAEPTDDAPALIGE